MLFHMKREEKKNDNEDRGEDIEYWIGWQVRFESYGNVVLRSILNFDFDFGGGGESLYFSQKKETIGD